MKLPANDVALLNKYALRMQVTPLGGGTLLTIRDVDRADRNHMDRVLQRLQRGVFNDVSDHPTGHRHAVCNPGDADIVGELVTKLADLGVNFPGAASHKTKSV